LLSGGGVQNVAVEVPPNRRGAPLPKKEHAMSIHPRHRVLRTRVTCAAFLALVAAVARPQGAAGQTATKVTICHIPPGNPANAHTITVDVSAIPAHLGHNDTLLACESCVPVGATCGGANGACCAGTFCNAAGMCEVPACMPAGGSCNPIAPNCCAGLVCNFMGFCATPG